MGKSQRDLMLRAEPSRAAARWVDLPDPSLEGAMPLERVLAIRRSVRSYAAHPLTLAEAGQLLWAAQGVTRPDGGRTAPSAGALHPLRTYLVAERVADLVPGVHAYIPGEQRLRQVEHGSTLSLLAAAACGQEWIADAPAVLVFSAAYAVTTGRYGERGQRYIDIEVGHAAQNAHLQATALGLCSVVVGAFDDAVVARLLHLDPSESPLCLLPVGRPRECAKKR